MPFPKFITSLKKTIKRLSIVLAVIAVLIVLVHLIENPRGKREWERTVQAVEAQGISLDWNDYTPTPIIDEINLGVAPVIAYWHRSSDSYTGPKDIQWQEAWGDVEQLPKLSKTLRSAAKDFENSEQWLEKAVPTESGAWLELAEMLAPYQPLLEEIRLQCRTRPESWIPGDYSKGFSSPIPSFQSIRDYGALLFAQSIQAIHQGDAERVLENTEAIRRIANINPGAYFIVNSMIETVVTRTYLMPIYREGIRAGIFTNSQLAELAEHCNEQNSLLQLEHSMHYETATCAHDIEQSINKTDMGGLLSIFGTSEISKLTNRLAPTGWRWIMISRLTNYQALHLSSLDGAQRRIDLDLARSNKAMIDEILEDPGFFDLLAAMAVPAYDKIYEVALDAHIQTDMTAIACSLELYRRSHDTYPESLDALLADGSYQIHNDPITGAPYHYKRVNEGYRLWSVGMNQIDDNGTRAESGKDHPDIVFSLSI